MLNELLTLEKAIRSAHFSYVPLHPDLKFAGKVAAFIVPLGQKGGVGSVWLLPNDLAPWTIRDGSQNSFPLTQPKVPLLGAGPDSPLRRAAIDKKNPEQRKDLLRVIAAAQVDKNAYGSWPGAGMLASIKKRQESLSVIQDHKASIVPETYRRFLRAFDPENGSSPVNAMTAIVESLKKLLEKSTHLDIVEAAARILLGEPGADGQWRCRGALIFEASGFEISIVDHALLEPVSRALSEEAESHKKDRAIGPCALTGEIQGLLEGNFPQPNLRVVGLTWLFAKNRDIPSNDRYGRFAQQSMPIGRGVVERLSGALTALTDPQQENVTWRAIPGERPKTADLFLAFADTASNAHVAGVVAADDFAEELRSETEEKFDSIAAFKKRAQDLARCFEGIPSTIDTSSEPLVHMMVIRKVDPANRKVVCVTSSSVRDLVKACNEWAAGEKNVPRWMRLPAVPAKDNKVRAIGPIHTAPLRFGGLSKTKYIKGGTESEEITGISTRTVMKIFMSGSAHMRALEHVLSTLHMMLSRRGSLLVGVVHGKRRRQDPRAFVDWREAPKTVAAIGLLLYKLGRKEEEYMNDSAFKLGQLLAAADAVHAGYCADMRKGAVPPALLGNQCLGIAQKNPVQALATLGRRWKPYDGWAKKMIYDTNQKPRVESLKNSKNGNEQQRGWDILVALRNAREMRAIAAELFSALQDIRIDDVFRAELLLGYIAGLPKAGSEAVVTEETISEENTKKEGEEN